VSPSLIVPAVFLALALLFAAWVVLGEAHR